MKKKIIGKAYRKGVTIVQFQECGNMTILDLRLRFQIARVLLTRYAEEIGGDGGTFIQGRNKRF